jgi:hypothetical protein
VVSLRPKAKHFLHILTLWRKVTWKNGNLKRNDTQKVYGREVRMDVVLIQGQQKRM